MKSVCVFLSALVCVFVVGCQTTGTAADVPPPNPEGIRAAIGLIAFDVYDLSQDNQSVTAYNSLLENLKLLAGFSGLDPAVRDGIVYALDLAKAATDAGDPFDSIVDNVVSAVRLALQDELDRIVAENS